MRLIPAILLCLMAMFLNSCSGEKGRDEQVIRLDKLEKISEEVPISKTYNKGFVVAIAAIISPEGTASSYDLLLEYISHKTGQPVKLVQRRTYSEINKLIATGSVDLAFVCTGAYINSKGGTMNILAVPVVNGKTTYKALVITSRDSGISSFKDLRGKTFAFTDPLSNTGYFYPISLIRGLGETPNNFFKDTFFTYSHDKAIVAVAQGIADGASVDNIVFQNLIKRKPDMARQLKIIHESKEFPMPPVVVPKDLPVPEQLILKKLFLKMHRDPLGQEALKKIGVERFVQPDMSLYSRAI